MQMRKMCITMIAILMMVGCDNAAGGGSTTTTPIAKESSVKKAEHNETKETNWANSDKWVIAQDPVEILLDDMTFSDAFRIEHLAKGEGHTFWWNGEEYTTDLYIDIPLDGNYFNWVRNSDDIDDHCRSNIWDECGTCDGKGPFTWYVDNDKDGLGNPSVYTKSCEYPSVDEE